MPQFVGENYISLENLVLISRFRSSVGHSSDANGTIPGETCQSMKHYFQFRDPATGIPTSSISREVFSPVDGTLKSVDRESNGNGLQLNIQPTAQPAFGIILFHVAPSAGIAAGARLTAGQVLGTVTESDVSVTVFTPQGFRIVSWFEVITAAVFQGYRVRGVAAREDPIISRAARDADPLTCQGERFLTFGNLPSFVAVNGHRCIVPANCLGQ